MNDFEKEILSAINNLKFEMNSNFSNIDKRISNIENEIFNIKNDISEMKENLDITRTAANYNGEKLDDLISELKASKTIE